MENVFDFFYNSAAVCSNWFVAGISLCKKHEKEKEGRTGRQLHDRGYVLGDVPWHSHRNLSRK